MKKIFLCMMLAATTSLAWSQTRPKAASRVDPCAPIGQTANRELVYSMNCNNLPAPPPLPVPAEIQPVPGPESETPRAGLFGMSIDRTDSNPGQGRTP